MGAVPTDRNVPESPWHYMFHSGEKINFSLHLQLPFCCVVQLDGAAKPHRRAGGRQRPGPVHGVKAHPQTLKCCCTPGICYSPIPDTDTSGTSYRAISETEASLGCVTAPSLTLLHPWDSLQPCPRHKCIPGTCYSPSSNTAASLGDATGTEWEEAADNQSHRPGAGIPHPCGGERG